MSPSKDRDADVDGEEKATSREKSHRRSKSERKPERDREHRHSHRSSKSSRSKVAGDGGEGSLISSSSRKHRSSRREREGRSEVDAGSDVSPSKSTLAGKRVSLPYPSFSKAHSKEAVMSRDDLSPTRRGNPLTPEPTDGGEDDRRRKSDDMSRKGSTSKKSSRPPTPPETEMSGDKRRSSAPGKDTREEGYSKPSSSNVSRSRSHNDDRSRVSRKSASSSQATFVKSAKHKSTEKLRTSESRASSSSRHSAKRSGSSRSAKKSGRERGSSPSSARDSSPRTPTQPSPFHVYADNDDAESSMPSKTATPASVAQIPPPPPPPPPPINIHEIPRVDYLLQNGGLPYPISRHFLSVLPIENGRMSNPPLTGCDTLFAPFFNLLDQYNKVLNKQGSIAVATGHRSVARRLLDRLENVFSRDLPPHGCSCVMCEKTNDIHRGLTWGDVLEWVSGRIDLPKWPPFDLAEIGSKAAELTADEPQRPSSPIKMDPDIAEEFREHYLRQTKKVRSAVDKWLNSTGETSAPPPQEVDDETLTFAILTNLDDDDRPFFNALLSGSRELKPATRAPTPLHKPRNDFIIKTGLSLQRLYRLQQVPRDAESASYLIKNPHTHDLLVTLSNINNSEWEILTSGRFDGFLWSGADLEEARYGTQTPASGFGGRNSMSPESRGPSAMGSRTTTPFSGVSRGATPASFVSSSSATTPGRQAVSNDEEMEMAAIAEVEREIYSGMESLEDAFEKLHLQAEIVRTALRQRGAGLMQSLQSRRRIDVLSTPGPDSSPNLLYEQRPWIGGDDDGVSESEWGGDDFDIMPDDSASNISSSRHRRPKRRTERRTPAPIEEDEEE